MEVVERVVAVETRLDIHDKRLKAHGDELEELRKQNIMQDAKLDGIDKKLTESCEITRSIRGGVDTVKWILAGVSTLGGLWLLVKQLGIF